MDLQSLQKELKELEDPQKAIFLQRFFKTGKGEYAHGDILYGIVVPTQRRIAAKYHTLPLDDICSLLTSKIHEERLIALFIIVHRFEKGDDNEKKQIYDLYLKSTNYINNWDLVDSSAAKIVGAYLLNKPRTILSTLAKSQLLWDRRIAIISTYYFIKNNQFEDTFKIAGILINDKHDLIQKAVGWMLREVGNRDNPAEEKFLEKYYKTMPRTALRYAIEKFPEKVRKVYLKGKK